MTIEEFFEHFATVYTHLDAEGVCQLFDLPFFTLVNEERTNWPELAPLLETTQALFQWYESQGFHDAHYSIISVLKLNEHLVNAQLRWRATRHDGSLWEYYTSYHLKQIDTSWKIAGVIQFEQDPTSDSNSTPLLQSPTLLASV